MDFILKDNIIYEDDNLLIVNKPRGLLLQQDGDNSHESLDKIVGDYLKMIAMPVHRLDKDTSGLKSFERKKMIVAPLKSGAKQAITKYHPIKIFKDYTLLDISLLTGRTHQIRAHMSYLRHHVVGDIKYGDYKVNNIFKREFNFENQFLHAYKIKFLDINGPLNYLKNKEFSCNLPPELEEILKKLDN